MTRHRLAVLGILVLALLLPLIPRYPVLAQDILQHGRWLVPEVRGQLYLNSRSSTSGPSRSCPCRPGE